MLLYVMLPIVTTLLLTNQCDIEKYDQSESEYSASLDSESSDSNESPSSSVHHQHPHPPPPSLSSFPLFSGGPDANRCFGRARGVWRTGRQRSPTSSQPCPSDEGWCFRDGGTLDTPSSWHGRSVGVGYLHLEGGR